MFFLQQNWKTKGQNRFCPEADGRGKGRWQIMYAHIRKCKNNKIIFFKKRDLVVSIIFSKSVGALFISSCM
jgi:hypothetical protein